MVSEKELLSFASVWKRVTEAAEQPAEQVSAPEERENRRQPVEKKRGVSRAVRFLPDF